MGGREERSKEGEWKEGGRQEAEAMDGGGGRM